MAFNVGELVNVVEADGTKALAYIAKLEKNAHGEIVAFVHRLEHDGLAIATEQTAVDPDPKVPVVEKLTEESESTVTSGTVNGSTLDALKG